MSETVGRPSPSGRPSATTPGATTRGATVRGAGALFLAEALDWSLVYAAMAALVVLGLIGALLAPEPQADPPHADPPPLAGGLGTWLKDMVASPFAEFFRRNGAKAALLVRAFILLYKLGDAFAGVMANPFYIQIGFSKAEIAGVSKVFGVLATLAGVFVGGVIVARFGVLWSLLGCGVLQMLSNLMFAAQAAVGADLAFLALTIGIENLSGGMGSAAFVAYLSLLCNTPYTGTQYALFLSFMAVGRTWLSASSGWVADQTDWVTFFVVSTVIALPVLIMLVWMTKRLPMAVQSGRSPEQA